MTEPIRLRPAQRRAAALVRDEGRLRAALAAQAARRFDLDALALVRDRTTELVETLRAIANDGAFWASLAAGAPPSTAQLSALSLVDRSAFEVLLVASGWTTPPPPEAAWLVDKTLDGLADALSFRRSDEQRRAAADRARSGLRLLLLKIRWQLDAAPDPAENPQLIVRCGRSAAAAARWLVPKAVALTAGILIEAHTVPGSGVGILVAKAAQKVVEDAIELGAERVMDRLAAPSDEPLPALPAPVEGPAAVPVAVVAHIAAIDDILAGISGRPERPARGAARRAALDEARRHLERVDELIGDHGLRLDAETQGLLDRLTELLPVVDEAGGPYGTSQDVLDADLRGVAAAARAAAAGTGPAASPGFFGGAAR